MIVPHCGVTVKRLLYSSSNYLLECFGPTLDKRLSNYTYKQNKQFCCLYQNAVEFVLFCFFNMFHLKQT